jgi:hypothetical protein
MKTSNYLKLCAAVTATWTLALIFIPTFADAIEAGIHIFLVITSG